jgi:hypothetical protein
MTKLSDKRNTVIDLGIHGLHPEIKVVGRMKYRSSAGQTYYSTHVNLTKLCGIMALN